MDASERWRILRLHVEDAIPLATLARSTGVTERTLQRWLARYRTGGYAALADDARADHGVRHTAPELVRLVEGLALTKPWPSIATIHRQVGVHCAERGLPSPSYSAVRSIVNGLDPGMVTLALEGPASYRDKHELLLRRRADRPNAIWQADHTMLDLLIVGPDGKPARPWLTVILDDYSRAICGYMVFLGAPSAANTALALRQAIWHKPEPDWHVCGIPDVLYTDHGSDFTSHRLGDTAAVLHLRIIHSQVARPQGRGKIERFFGTINTELLPTLPGHLAAGSSAPTPALDLGGVDSAISTFIRSYNARTHRELRTSPLHAWIADGWLPRLPESLEQLDGFLLTVPTTAPSSSAPPNPTRNAAKTATQSEAAHSTFRAPPVSDSWSESDSGKVPYARRCHAMKLELRGRGGHARGRDRQHDHVHDHRYSCSARCRLNAEVTLSKSSGNSAA